MPAPDTVKPLHKQLDSETATERNERLELERKQRIEMALARRDQELQRREAFEQFYDNEQRRRAKQVQDKVCTFFLPRNGAMETWGCET